MIGTPKILGLNLGGHDGGCCLIIGNRIYCAISEERLNRQRYSPNWIASLQYCLQAANTSLSAIDLIVFSSYGPELPIGYNGGITFLGDTKAEFISVDHHLSHAMGAYALSPFKESLMVVMDAWGNNADSESYYYSDGKEISRIGSNNPARPIFKGIGSAYGAFSNFLGFSDQEAGKTMGLASYGDPEYFSTPLFEITDNQVASGLELPHHNGVIKFAQKHNLNIGNPFPPHTSEISWHVAAYIQKQTEEAVVNLVRNLFQQTTTRNLCLSGGVALNCLINSRIRQTINPDGLFILPFASDTGQPVGNALYGYYTLTGEIPKIPLTNCFFGRSYTEEEILNSLKRLPGTTRYDRILQHSFTYTKETDIARVAAQLIADGKIVGWFQGGSELGPRALGHRSILADPRSVVTRDLLNTRIKNREWFRPFAPSVLLEEIDNYFECGDVSPFMLEAPTVKAKKRYLIPAAIHVDGTARPQTVSETQDPLYYKLIKEFRNITGIPAVLNTSFNKQEPIVESPGDALLTFRSTNLDFLILGDYLVSKIHN